LVDRRLPERRRLRIIRPGNTTPANRHGWEMRWWRRREKAGGVTGWPRQAGVSREEERRNHQRVTFFHANVYRVVILSATSVRC